MKRRVEFLWYNGDIQDSLTGRAETIPARESGGRGAMMVTRVGSIVLMVGGLLAATPPGWGQEPKPYTGAACNRNLDDFFTKEVWPKVGATFCLQCHKKGGDAEDSKLVLQDPRKFQGHAQEKAIRHNRDLFAHLATVKHQDQYRLLVKVTGGLDHGGEEVLKPGSKGYQVLAEFVRRINAPPTATPLPVVDESKLPPFFAGVTMLDPQRLMRRVTLSLAGRLPTKAERAVIADTGEKGLPPLLDGILDEDAFYDRLREGFNDIFLTVGLDGNAETEVHSYEHFEKTRLWTAKFDLSHVPEKERQKARYKLDADNRKALLGEPMKLVEHIVRHNRPFTEIVTADYIMVTPYSARGYGVFEELKSKFKNVDDPLEYIPVKLKALKGRSKSTDQESASGYYPHAGMLSMFHYLRRYPTTETNRNRLRARMVYQHFLGVDVLELAARVSDAAAVSAKYKVPTMEASECVVCHKTLDPLASLFQDFYSFDATYGRRKGGWYQDMFPAGFEGETMEPAERWRSLQWLGERTAKDPRFAVAMVEHVYYILTGRKVLLAPKDLEDPLYASKRRAYQEQRRQVEVIADRFTKSGFNLKNAFKDWILSDFYRADGLGKGLENPTRKAELEDLGVVRMLSPEQVERKVNAVFGQPWGRLHDQLAILYGGIDSKEVTERATDPSGAMGAIQRILSNDVACTHTLRDFMRKAPERRLFPGIEPHDLPGISKESDEKIRQAIVHLHELILGRQDALHSKEVERTYELFAGIVADAKLQKGLDKRETYHCRANIPDAPNDPNYTIRAWRGVVTYLLRRPEFLYE